MKQLLLIILTTGWTVFIVAQPIYHAEDFANPGDEHLFSSTGAMQLTGLNFQPTGENHTWDFTALTPTAQQFITYLDPNENGFRESYILTCIAGGGNPVTCLNNWTTLAYMSQTATDTLDLGGLSMAAFTTIYDKENSGLIHTMMAALAGTAGGFLPVVIALDDPDTLLKFPLYYGLNYTSHGRYRIDLTPVGQPFIYSYDRFSHAEADGYGTLILPWKTYSNVLRLKTEIFLSDTLIVDGSVVENPMNHQIRYQWFSPEENMVLSEVNGYVLFNTLEVYTDAKWRDTLICLNPAALFGWSPFFPAIDPETNLAEVNFINFSSNSDEWQWNFDDPESGLLNFSTERNPIHRFNNTRAYHVMLTAINNRCNPVTSDTLTLPVTISDTTSTGIPSDPARQFALHPNPFCEQLTLQWSTPGNFEIILLDSYGRITRRKEIKQGNACTLNTRHIASGLYHILVISENGMHYSSSAIKFNQ
ncbi:MAG: hypothetical protein EOL88_07795 [Bacteroidia bacterium]|nr:hypothetical protein [Bacteroidia bacterium]